MKLSQAQVVSLALDIVLGIDRRSQVMPMNRVQFQSGLSLGEFFRQYGSEQQCEAALASARWPHGFVCPRCAHTSYSCFRRAKHRLWQCSACRHQTSLRAGTVFDATKLPLTTWFLAMFLLTQSKNSIATLELRRHLGVAYRSAWLIKHKLMQSMAEREADRRLTEHVQVDDAFLGGERTGGKRGRGSENKVPFVAAIQTRRGHPIYARFDIVPNWQMASMHLWASKALLAGAHVVSDGLSTFSAVRQAGCTHEPIPHGSGKASTQHPKFIWVNTVLGNLKTMFESTYKGVKAAKYGQRYLAEFQYRFNRRFDLRAMLPNLLHAAAITSPYPEYRIRAAEVHG